jgi:hypothetical protein
MEGISEKVKQYESLLANVRSIQELLEKSELYKKLISHQKELSKLEKEIKTEMKASDIPTKIEGNRLQFILQIKHSHDRTYDLELIKKMDELLARRVIIETVDDSVFRILEKEEKISNPLQYYKMSENVTKAILIQEIKKEE